MAIMTINAVAKAGSASRTGNYSLIWSGLSKKFFQGCTCFTLKQRSLCLAKGEPFNTNKMRAIIMIIKQFVENC